MKYIHTTTLAVAQIDEIRAANANMSVPEGADLSGLGYAKLHETPQSQCPEWHVCDPGQPVIADGKWSESWVVRAMSAQEKSDRAASKIQQIEQESGIVRILREATILQLETWATGQGYPLTAFRAANKGYRLLKETDEMIAVLREQIV